MRNLFVAHALFCCLTFPSYRYTTYSSLGLQQLPMQISPICVVYSKNATGNLGSIDDTQLSRSMPVVASLIAGRITYWDDTHSSLTPQVAFTTPTVSVVVRSDKISLNEAVTSVLNNTTPWWSRVPYILKAL